MKGMDKQGSPRKIVNHFYRLKAIRIKIVIFFTLPVYDNATDLYKPR